MPRFVNLKLEKSDQSPTYNSYRKYKSENGANTDPWTYQRWDLGTHGLLDIPEVGSVSRGSKYPYKHGPLDIPEVESGAMEE
jgi:hypothetical protein